MIHKECTHKFSLRSVENIALACVHQTSKFPRDVQRDVSHNLPGSESKARSSMQIASRK